MPPAEAPPITLTEPPTDEPVPSPADNKIEPPEPDWPALVATTRSPPLAPEPDSSTRLPPVVPLPEASPPLIESGAPVEAELNPGFILIAPAVSEVLSPELILTLPESWVPVPVEIATPAEVEVV